MAISTVLLTHIESTIKDVGVQIGHAKTTKHNRAKSGYYRAAILLSAALVEAVLHDLIDMKCTHNPNILSGVNVFKRSKGVRTIQKLDSAICANGKELWICEVDRSLIDRRSSFKDMNDLALQIGIVGKRLYNKLEKVRKKRNEIHIQTLQTGVRNYNYTTVEYTSTVLLELLSFYRRPL